MECKLITTPLSNEIYIEGVPQVLSYIDNKSAYVYNGITYVRLSDYLNGVYEKEVIEACYYTEEQDIEILLLEERFTIGQLLAIGDKISYNFLVSVGVKYCEESIGQTKLLSVIYRKMF